MAEPPEKGLTARERQIMDVIWELGEATIEDLRLRMTEHLTGSTLRTLLGILEDKGYVSGCRCNVTGFSSGLGFWRGARIAWLTAQGLIDL